MPNRTGQLLDFGTVIHVGQALEKPEAKDMVLRLREKGWIDPAQCEALLVLLDLEAA